MVLNLEQFNLEDLAARNTVKILRLMINKPYLTWGLTELSNELKISKSNVSRILKVLLTHNIINEQKTKRKKVYRIDYEMSMVQIMWKLFMEEKRQRISPEFKNRVDLLYNQVEGEVELFILFGSVATGLATEKSDIDIITISENPLNIKKYDYLPYRFEIHQYSWEDIRDPVDFVVLESLTNGIVFKGDVFKIIAGLNSFPKPYIIYRLEKAKEFLKKAQSLEGDAQEYYKNIAEITIGEVQSVTKKGITIPKKEIKLENINEIIKELEKELSNQGERIWLT
ncbi:nucleotidyltransferase domain-containing protein [Methanobacterium sp.]|uniref:nucleotidyltransferase domain-containing protein n=1 Tax=Methanobacterium sp. TaxID=2164 RepID=UPI0025CDFCB2|nr:nucleotidyltransferase domain-containing protein [Methanobacterium sp.]MBI5459227.1 nucleotidyltransferase domain-containing protein [Methanobacterium sp.]